MSPSTTTSRRSRQSNTQGQLLFAGGHRANPSHAPGSDWARKTTASSGKRLFPLFSESDPLGAYSKTLLGSEQWASMEFLLNWRIITTPQGRSVFQLAPSAPRTGECDTGLFAKAWITPKRPDGGGSKTAKNLAHQHRTDDALPTGQMPSGCLARTERFVVRLMILSAWLMGYQWSYLKHWQRKSMSKSRKAGTTSRPTALSSERLAIASSRRSPKSSSKP